MNDILKIIYGVAIFLFGLLGLKTAYLMGFWYLVLAIVVPPLTLVFSFIGLFNMF